MLAALAIRLAAVEALCPTAALQGLPGVVFPTIAAGRVADSRIMPRDDRDPATALPFLAVYTEDSRGEPDGELTATTPLECDVMLVVECEVKILDADPEADPAGPPDLAEIVPETDPAAEAMLDLLAAQVIHALEVGPGGSLFRKLRQRVKSVEMVPLRDAMLGVRFARRTMRIALTVFGEDWSTMVAGGLPAPLSTVAAGLPADSYGAGLIETIRGALVSPASLPAFELIVAGFGPGARPASLEAAPIGLRSDL